MPRLTYKGISAFSTAVRNLRAKVKSWGVNLTKNSAAEREVTRIYGELLLKYAKENTSGRKIKLSGRTLDDKKLNANLHLGKGGSGTGVSAISLRVTGTNEKTNMIGRALILDHGGWIKARRKRFLTVPLGRKQPPYSEFPTNKTTFQVYQKRSLRGTRVTKNKKRLTPRFLAVRGPGDAINFVYLLTRKIKITKYLWAQDAAKRALISSDAKRSVRTRFSDLVHKNNKILKS